MSSTIYSRACELGRAGCWSFAARQGSARQRCSTVSPVARPIFGSSARRASSPRWSSPMRGCTSSARRSRIRSTACPAHNRTRSKPRSDGATATRRTGSSSASRSWACSRTWRRSSPSCGWWTTGSGSTRPRRRPSRSWRAGSKPSRSPWSSRCGTTNARTTSRGSTSSSSPDSRSTTRMACSRRCSPARSTNAPATPAPLEKRAAAGLVAEARGNPLALLELPHGLTPAEMAGGFGLPHASSLTSRIEESFRRRLPPLPPSTRTLLLIASADPIGDPVPVWRAAGALGVEPAARVAAADLVEFGGQVRFRHPLVRSAVYRAASPEERERTHRALADATDPEVDPDRRAWHRAHATPVADEDVAAELERSAGRAQGRGGQAAAAAFLERAAELTPEPARRARRSLAAAQSKQRAGAPDAALRLLGFAEAGPLAELDQLRAELLRGQVTFAVTRGGDAPQLLLQTAKRLEPLDGALARETYLDAFAAALFADRLARGVGVREIAEAVLAAKWGEAPRHLPMAFDLLLEGIARVTIDGYSSGAPTLKRALTEFHDAPMSDEDALRWLWLACRAARALGEDAISDELTERQVRLARDAGELSLLSIALAERFSLQLFLGDHVGAEASVLESEVVAAATGSRLAPQRALLAALRGEEAEATALIDAERSEVLDRGEGLWLVITEWASAVLFNSLGRYEEALAAAEQTIGHPHELGVSTWVQPEFIEAAARSGHPERAAGPMRRLQEISSAAGTDWALGVEARSRALLSEGDVAEELYCEAITRLSRTRVRTALARAHLVYGEWLRRQRRRAEAREHLRIAHGMWADIAGMHGFAERARRERMATGETVRKRTPDTRDRLTAQEGQIARLAAEGCTNPEIGAQLFISPRTVEWHLRGVFTKLGIHSRKELSAAAQARQRGGAAPAG